MQKRNAWILFLTLALGLSTLLARPAVRFADLMTAVELDPAIYLEARQAALDRGLPLRATFDDGVLVEIKGMENGQPVYVVIRDLAHPFRNGETAFWSDVEQSFDLSRAEVYYGGRSAERSGMASVAPGDSLLFVVDWTTDGVFLFDYATGDLVDDTFIRDALHLSSPKQALLSPMGTITVPDQIEDIVLQYDTAGFFIDSLAPAGGENNDILDNLRGHNYHPNTGNLLVTVASGLNSDAIAEFDQSGNYLGNFIANGAGALDSPFDIIFRDSDVLVTASTSDAVHRYDYSGAFLNLFAGSINFPQQVKELPDGNVAVAQFSSPGSGVKVFDPNGTLLRTLSGVDGNRGVMMLGNGNIITTNGGGVHEVDYTTGALIRTITASGSFQFIDLYVVPGASTPTVDKLLLTEIVVTPTGGEYVEIHNPGTDPVDLSNYYLTDATFDGGSTYYYQIVEGGGGGGGFGDFHARFPVGATIAPGEYQTVAMIGTDFVTEYSVQPTYELYDTDAAIADMLEAFPGSVNGQGGLTNGDEVVILYHWDGASDLVTDVDYLLYNSGSPAPNNEAVDKTGVLIDGPDADSDSSAYQPDTPIANQMSAPSHDAGFSVQRVDLSEGAQVMSGSNGIDGADETSEDLNNTFVNDGTPTPNGPYAPAPVAAKLLLTEIVVTPTEGEYVEIYNPGTDPVDLSDYYLTDATFDGGSTYYYQIVEGGGGGGGFGDFHARFPAGASIAAGEYQTVAMHGANFVNTYAVQPTYELFDTDAGIPDMLEAFPGSVNGQGGLTNGDEVVILYYWDGASDLVGDVDYLLYNSGSPAPNNEAVDKTGVSMDGPDADSDSSAYLDDTPIANQLSAPSHDGGFSVQRVDLAEGAQVTSGGNGVTGADETSEDLNNTFVNIAAPTPNGPYVAPMARVQVIHNAADPAADTVDVYLNDAILLDDFAFRTATPYVDVPAGVVLNIGIAPGNSGSVVDTLVNFPLTLAAGGTYGVVANGVIDPSGFLPNPDGLDISLRLFLQGAAREASSGADVEFYVVHGISDAPGVDISVADGGPTLVNNALYGDVTGYIAVAPAFYTLDITDSSQTDLFTSFEADLTTLGGQSLVILASGFSEADSNQSGPGAELIAVFADGSVDTLVQLGDGTFYDDFEAYSAGTQLVVQNPNDWTTWSGPSGTAEDPFVSDAFAFSGTNSVVVVENNDFAKPLGQQTTGSWGMSFHAYIPNGKAGYFNTLAGFTPNPFNWGMEVYFDAGGLGRLRVGGNDITFAYPYDSWQFCEVIVDLDQDSAQFILDGELIGSWQWTDGAGGAGVPLQLDANNFFGATPNDEMYIDDYLFRQDTLRILVAIDDNQPLAIPREFSLEQNYPNPFNPTTTIRYGLKGDGQVTLTIYNMLGQKVRTLVNGYQNAGFREVVWNGTNDLGNRVASGVYFYRLEAQDFVTSRKMILMK